MEKGNGGNLTIGSESGSGQLVAVGGDGGAGIGSEDRLASGNYNVGNITLTGGDIFATGNGGGVYIYRTGSVCQLYSGKIENNKASGNGGGIYINPSSSGQLRV